TFPISSARRPTAASKLLELLEAAEARPAVRRKISTPRLACASPPAPGQSNGSRLRSPPAAADFADRWELPPLQERLPVHLQTHSELPTPPSSPIAETAPGCAWQTTTGGSGRTSTSSPVLPRRDWRSGRPPHAGDLPAGRWPTRCWASD